MLLESKFYQPRFRQEIVVRPRLLDQLTAGLQRKLILVLAQAGFGKTTLVANWLNTLGQEIDQEGGASNTPPTFSKRVAWLSLDENDNDPLRFFDYLITTLQRADASIGQHARFLLSAPQPPANLEPLVISLINDLATLSDHLILALDDYHTITSPEVHHIIHYFVSHSPERFHLVIASRIEPPLPLTRWRMYRELTEIRENDLRFTLNEAMTYLLETMRCTISRADVAALEQRTEGWIVGLHLAALSLQSRADNAAFIADFTGSHAYIVDYLTEEVLQRQSPEILEFLFQTSRLSRFCGPLCDAVLGRTGSQKILELLERSHLFVVPLDNERGWYRYHHLFAEMLRRRAQEHDLQHAAEAYRRAAQWHVEKGLVMEAVEYALAAANNEEDSEYAAELIERSLPSLVARGHFVTLMQWLNRLPPAILRSRPLLCVTRARSALRQQQLDEAEKWLETTWSALAAQSSQDMNVVGEAYALRVDLVLNRGRLAETIQLANEALEILPEELLHARGEILLFLGIAYYWEAQYVEAATVTTQSADFATRAGDILTAIYAWFNLARFAHTQGKFHESMAALDQTWRFAMGHNAHELPLMGSYHNNMGQMLYEWNRLDIAEEHFLEAIRSSEQVHNPRTALRGYSLVLPVYLAKGQQAQAEETVQTALRIMRQYELSTNILDECSRTIIHKWIFDGNWAAVAEWIKTRGLSLTAPEFHTLEHEYYLVARYLAAQNKLSDAAELLEKVAASAHAAGKMTLYIAIEAHHALVLQQMGDTRAAFAMMTHLLEIAEPEGYIRTFVDEGKAMQTLLAALQPRLTLKLQGYVALLLQAFGQPSPNAPQASTPAPSISAPSLSASVTPAEFAYVERLSDRELEVLRLVDNGLSDSQIANQLVLAIGTVKRHLNNIYGKLGVHNRTHALARARTLKLL